MPATVGRRHRGAGNGLEELAAGSRDEVQGVGRVARKDLYAGSDDVGLEEVSQSDLVRLKTGQDIALSGRRFSRSAQWP